MRWLRLLLWPAAVVLGLAAESHLYGWGDTRHWAPDLAVGWITFACGLIAWWRRPDSGSGPLLAAAGGAWFVANFSSDALYLHRGPLVHLALTYPSGRARGKLQHVAIAIGYGTAIVPSAWGTAGTAVLLAGALLFVAIREYAIARPNERSARVRALAASTWLAALFAGTAATRLASASEAAASATLIAYQIGIALFALGVVTGLVVGATSRVPLTDLVVELGEGESGGVRDALALALGDPTLEIGFPLPGGSGFVDARGRSLELPGDDSNRRVIHLQRDGADAVVLVHDEGAPDDPELLEAVNAAARLAAANARLHAEVRRQVDEVDASRRRLVRAGDEQRQRLEQRLRDGAMQRLAEIDSILARGGNGSLTPETCQRLEQARARLAETVVDLRELGAGLHPRVLTEHGLAIALASLAERSPVATELVVPDVRFPPEVEAAVYFVCSEALANVAKHASAQTASVSIRVVPGELVAEVIDDGRGGAAITGGGTGIRGLADRVEALGGSLELVSAPAAGTRVRARLPLGPDQR